MAKTNLAINGYSPAIRTTMSEGIDKPGELVFGKLGSPIKNSNNSRHIHPFYQYC